MIWTPRLPKAVIHCGTYGPNLADAQFRYLLRAFRVLTAETRLLTGIQRLTLAFSRSKKSLMPEPYLNTRHATPIWRVWRPSGAQIDFDLWCLSLPLPRKKFDVGLLHRALPTVVREVDQIVAPTTYRSEHRIVLPSENIRIVATVMDDFPTTTATLADAFIALKDTFFDPFP